MKERAINHIKRTTGEWTVFGTSVQVNGEALFHCSTRKDAVIASLEHNAALAAATGVQHHMEAVPNDEVLYVAIEELQQQLAAEREKVRHVTARKTHALVSIATQLDWILQHAHELTDQTRKNLSSLIDEAGVNAEEDK